MASSGSEPGVMTIPAVGSLRARAVGLVFIQLAGLLGMMAVTARLWWPSGSLADSADLQFPAIPVFAFLVGIDPWVHMVVTVITWVTLLVGVVLCFRARQQRALQWLCLGIAGLLVLQVLLNQHRFLPWVLQSMILLIGFGLLAERDFLRLMRVLIVTIYIYSAISKLDYQFVRTTGRQILETMVGWAGWDVSGWSVTALDGLVLGFPVMELLIGIGLVLRQTRLVAAILGMGMHLMLILVLGPWGLDHAESVLLWNGLFVAQLGLLYWPARRSVGKAVIAKDPGVSQRSDWVVVLTWVLCVYPLAEKFDAIDHWPAWGLYSPRASRCRLRVADWKVAQLPSSARELFRPVDDEWTGMRECDLGTWSIRAVNAPVYPQDRFQLGLARYLVEQLDVDRAWEVEIQSASGFWTGKRQVETITTREELEHACRQFWVNSEASRWWTD